MRGRRGHSFVEVAIATLFLALALVPLVDSILSTSRRAQEDRMRVFATALAGSAIERYRLETPAAAAAAVGGAAGDPILNPLDAPDSWQDFRDQFLLDVSFVPTGATGVLTARVTWEEGGHTREVQLQTLLANSFAPGAP